jgi:hypothetical protein
MYSVKVYENAGTSISAESSGQFIEITVDHNKHIERVWLLPKDAQELAEGILFLVQTVKK